MKIDSNFIARTIAPFLSERNTHHCMLIFSKHDYHHVSSNWSSTRSLGLNMSLSSHAEMNAIKVAHDT